MHTIGFVDEDSDAIVLVLVNDFSWVLHAGAGKASGPPPPPSTGVRLEFAAERPQTLPRELNAGGGRPLLVDDDGIVELSPIAVVSIVIVEP